MNSRRQRGWLLLAVLVVLVGAAVGGWLLISQDDRSASDEGAPEGFKVFAVKRETLTVGESFTGQVGYGSPAPIPLRSSGTVTWLPGLGMLAEQGDKIIGVDGRPVILMYGSVPAYRALHDEPPAAHTGSDGGPRSRGGSTGLDDAEAEGQGQGEGGGSDDSASVGSDVAQFEQGLRNLGYTGFTVDDEFTSATATAVKRWQEDLGVEATGRVEDGDVVFLPGPVRLYPDTRALGGAVTDTTVQMTGTTKIVTVQVDEGGSNWAVQGEKVVVTLPDQTKTPGRVTGTASPSDAQSEAGMPSQQVVRIKLSAPRKAKLGPASVTRVAATAKKVLAVPVTALVALAEGGYGLQLEAGEYIPVKPGLYADGMVEVEGKQLTKGTRIRVPQ